jgi:hypothetical protein
MSVALLFPGVESSAWLTEAVFTNVPSAAALICTVTV